MSFRALLDPRVLDRSAPFHGWCRWPCRMGRYGRVNYSAWDIARPCKTRPQRLRTEHMKTPTQLGSLRNAISFDRPPLCSGAISPPPEGLYLWHGKKSSRLVQFSSHPRPSAVDICPHRFVNFASATDEDLDTLTPSLQRATRLHLVAEMRMSTTNLIERHSRWMPRISLSSSTSQLLG